MKLPGSVVLFVVAIACSFETNVRADTPAGVWERVRDPSLGARYALHVSVERRLAELAIDERRDSPTLSRRDSLSLLRDTLLAAGAENSPDVRLRFDLGRTLEMLEDYARAAAVLEAAIAMAPDHALADEALWQLAICYAHVDTDRELGVYDRYLARAVRSEARAIAMSNRAEAWMRAGELELAIVDAQAALALAESPDTSALAGFDLAVALDRRGDSVGAAAAMRDAVSVARTSQRGLRMIMHDGEGVFFVPDHDKHWYRAMLLAELARTEDDATGRVSLLEASAAQWSLYVARAASDDRWRPLAMRRRARAVAELERTLRQRGRAGSGVGRD